MLVALLVSAAVVPAVAGAYKRPAPGADKAKPYFDIRVGGSSGAAAVTSGAHVTKAMTDGRNSLAHLKSRTAGTFEATLLEAGTKKASLRLTSAVRSAMRRHHVRSVKVTITLSAVDANNQRVRVTRSATVRR